MIRAAIAGWLILIPACLWASPYPSKNGQFTVSEIRGCDPLTITITVRPDLPGGACAFFAYRPFGTADDTRNGPSGNVCSVDLTYDVTITQSQTYKLQVFSGGVGADNVDEIMITVDPDIKPAFDISSCNNIKAQVLITDKTYDQYFIDFNYNSGITAAIPSGNNPTSEFTYTSPGLKKIGVRGKRLNSADNCSVQEKDFTAVATLPDAVIQTLSVKDETSIDLTFSPQANVQYRTDLSLNNQTSFQPVRNIFETTAASRTENFGSLQTSANYYCVRLRKFDPCLNTSAPAGNTPYICTVRLNAEAQNKKNSLSWTPSDPLISAYTISRNSDLNFASVTATTFQDNTVACKTDYCYRVTAQWPGNAKSISAERCVKAFSTDIPDPITDISTAVEESGAKFLWIESTLFTPTVYSIRRAKGGNNFLTIAETPDNNYQDASYAQKPVTSYQIAYTDACDNKSPASKTFRPVDLSGEVKNDNSINLNWNAYNGYLGGVLEYQVTKFDDQGTVLGTETTTDTVYTDNIRDPDHQRVRYRVTAKPVNTLVDISLSNTAEFTRQARLVFPTAFTPDGKGPAENETFRVFGEYIESIELKIFDRWGKLLFTTNDLGKPWDGRSNGQELPQSSYIWRAEIVDKLGKTFIRTGSVALLRN
ncbi:MAG: T9SS type B sorting domain-containing protein [Cyclobacteriaceae bacterium]